MGRPKRKANENQEEESESREKRKKKTKRNNATLSEGESTSTSPIPSPTPTTSPIASPTPTISPTSPIPPITVQPTDPLNAIRIQDEEGEPTSTSPISSPTPTISPTSPIPATTPTTSPRQSPTPISAPSAKGSKGSRGGGTSGSESRIRSSAPSAKGSKGSRGGGTSGGSARAAPSAPTAKGSKGSRGTRIPNEPVQDETEQDDMEIQEEDDTEKQATVEKEKHRNIDKQLLSTLRLNLSSTLAAKIETINDRVEKVEKNLLDLKEIVQKVYTFLEKYDMVFSSWITMTSSIPVTNAPVATPIRTLLEYSNNKVRDFIKYFIMPRGLGFGLNQLWACIALVFKIEPQHRKHEDFSHFYSTLKNQFKGRLNKVRSAMWTDGRNILSESDAQFLQFADHLRTHNMDRVILEFQDLIEIQPDEVNNIWGTKFLNYEFSTTSNT